MLHERNLDTARRRVLKRLSSADFIEFASRFRRGAGLFLTLVVLAGLVTRVEAIKIATRDVDRALANCMGEKASQAGRLRPGQAFPGPRIRESSWFVTQGIGRGAAASGHSYLGVIPKNIQAHTR